MYACKEMHGTAWYAPQRHKTSKRRSEQQVLDKDPHEPENRCSRAQMLAMANINRRWYNATVMALASLLRVSCCTMRTCHSLFIITLNNSDMRSLVQSNYASKSYFRILINDNIIIYASQNM